MKAYDPAMLEAVAAGAECRVTRAEWAPFPSNPFRWAIDVPGHGRVAYGGGYSPLTCSRSADIAVEKLMRAVRRHARKAAAPV